MILVLVTTILKSEEYINKNKLIRNKQKNIAIENIFQKVKQKTFL